MTELACLHCAQPLTDARGLVPVPVRRVADGWVHEGDCARDYQGKPADGPAVPNVFAQLTDAGKALDEAHREIEALRKMLDTHAGAERLARQRAQDAESKAGQQYVRAQAAVQRATELEGQLVGVREALATHRTEADVMLDWMEQADWQTVRYALAPETRAERGGLRESIRKEMTG